MVLHISPAPIPVAGFLLTCEVQKVKTINYVIFIVVAAISSNVFAKDSDKVFEKRMSANSVAMEQYAIRHGKKIPVAKQYKYGMKLDVVNVVSMVRPAEGCGVMPAAMTYEDSEGVLNTVRYTVAGKCRKGG